LSVQGIVGVLHLDGRPVDEQQLHTMAREAGHRGSPVALWSGPGAALGHQSPNATSRDLRPEVHGHLACVADARLDDRSMLRDRLLSRGIVVTEDADDATLVLGAFQAWGRDCPEYLYGDYAVAIWDQQSRQLFLARDPMGMRALYFRHEPRRRLLFATELKQLLVAPDVPMEIDELAIAANLAGPYLPGDRTLYAGIEQLPAGHAMVVDPERSRSWSHWQPDPRERLEIADSEAADAYRERFERAVRDRLDTTQPVGISLSGGLDSINLASMAGWLQQGARTALPPLHAYAWRFDEIDGADERSVSDLVVGALQIEGHTVHGDDCWPLSDADRAAPDRDDPFQWPYQALINRTHRHARTDGVGLFLSGARGDELTGDWAFDEFGLLRAGRAREAWQELGLVAQAHSRRTVAAAARTAAAELLHRWPELEPRPLSRRRAAAPRVAPWLPDALRRRTGLDDLVASSGKLPRFGGLGRSTRFARVTSAQSARLAAHAERTLARIGMVAADPYADRRLAELILALPAWQVQRRSEPKRLARRALTGIVPETARIAATKNIPSRLYDAGMRDKAVATIDTLLTAPLAASHGWLDAEAVRAVHDRYLRTGEITHDYWWVLTTELWLRRWWA
jgi:asparagine synthase (glutamine-hydrolysing)